MSRYIGGLEADELIGVFEKALAKFANLNEAGYLARRVVREIKETYENQSPAFVRMQLQRRNEILRAFQQRFGDGKVILIRAPGRVNLIGEHTDNQDGYVLPVALDKDIIIALRPTEDGSVVLHNMDEGFYGEDGRPNIDLTSFNANNVPFVRTTEYGQPAEKAPDTLPIGPNGEQVKIYGRTFTYVMGAAKGLHRFVGHDIKGAQMLIDGRVEFGGIPAKAGVSSSSALTVASAIAFATANDVVIGPVQLSELTCDWERYQTGGGMMDQFTSINAKRGHAIFLDCRRVENPRTPEEAFNFETLVLPEGYKLIAMNTRTLLPQVDSEYNERRSCTEIGTTWLRFLFLKNLLKNFPNLRNKRMDRIRDFTPENLGIPEEKILEIFNLLPEYATKDEILNSDYGQQDTEFLLKIFKERPTQETTYWLRKRCLYQRAENMRVLAAREALIRKDVSAFAKAINDGQTNDEDGGAEKGYEISCPELDLITGLALKRGAISARLSGKGWGGVAVAIIPPNVDVDEFIDKVSSDYEAATGEVDAPIHLNKGTDIFVCSTSKGAGIERYQSEVVIAGAKPRDIEQTTRTRVDVYSSI